MFTVLGFHVIQSVRLFRMGQTSVTGYFFHFDNDLHYLLAVAGLMAFLSTVSAFFFQAGSLHSAYTRICRANKPSPATPAIYHMAYWKFYALENKLHNTWANDPRKAAANI